MADLQFKRKVKLIVSGAGGDGLDLSSMWIKFSIKAADVESPNNASIRIYNLSAETTKQITREFKEVTLEAGYQSNCGVIFKGTVKWFREGRDESGTDTYLDLLAADGDIPYNQSIIAMAIEAGTTSQERVKAISEEMKNKGLGSEPKVYLPETGGILPRGKVLWGMARAALTQEAESNGATWSIQDGELVMLPLDSFLPGEAILLTGQSGLIGRPEQTIDGIKAKALINPAIKVGGRVKLDNASINTTTQSSPGAPVAYNQYTNLQFVANLAGDGIYRVYVIEYDGDTRGMAWYATLTLLAVDSSAGLVVTE